MARLFLSFYLVLASVVAQTVKNPLAMWETWVRLLDWEDSPGEGNGNPVQYPCLESPMDREARPKSMGSQRIGHD